MTARESAVRYLDMIVHDVHDMPPGGHSEGEWIIEALDQHQEAVDALVRYLSPSIEHPTTRARTVADFDGERFYDGAGYVLSGPRVDAGATPEEQGLTPGGERRSFDEEWTDLIREFPTKRDATVRGILDKHRPALRAAALDALRDEVDPDDDERCVDCGVELEDGNYTLICRECADVDD